MPDIGQPDAMSPGGPALFAAIDRHGPAAEVQRLLRAATEGALSTLSLQKRGWPFASLAPYALSRRGEPVLLLSTIAQHTKNLRADPRACLLVREPGPADGRCITVLGRVHPVGSGEAADARARYLARHLRAEPLFAAHDYGLYLLAIEEVRFAAGFGSMGWVSGSDVAVDPSRDPLAPHAGGLCGLINENHAPALSLLCKAFRNKAGDAARMVGIDSLGFDVEVWKGARVERIRFDFPEALRTPEAVRQQLVEMLRDGRIRLGAAGRDGG